MKASERAETLKRWIEEYQTLVNSVETQTCDHGPGGSKRAGADYQACCGISYEYLNDLGCRNALQDLIKSLPPDEATELKNRLRPLDDRLRALQQGDDFLLDAKMQTTYPRNVYWWYYGLPRGVKP